jgi:hypothetical protein
MPEHAPRAELAHAMEGRTRLRFREHAGDAGALAAIATRLGELDGIETVSIRAFSGTVVMTHEGRFDEYAERAVRAGMLQLVAAAPDAGRDQPLVLTARAAPALAAAAFAAFGLLQIGEKRILPPAVTLFWYATELFRRARRAAD